MSCNFKEYFKNKVSKACILTLFETIRNFREKMKTRMITGAFYGN